MSSTHWNIDYESVLQPRVPEETFDDYSRYALIELGNRFSEVYAAMMPRPVDVLWVPFDSFRYYYDLQNKLDRTALDFITNRLVAVIGHSKPQRRKRPTARIRGWLGSPNYKTIGADKDKGHFMAQSIGATALDVESNLFVQDRALNRGWSAQGKKYRAMERYCVQHPNTLCFSRPHYECASDQPWRFDFGILLEEGRLWVETFDN